MVVAIVNNKGGVGKTTLAVNLATALARFHTRRVLLVDLDSQASASRWLGVERQRLTPSMATCLLESFPIDRAIRGTGVPGLDLVTGSAGLANADVALCDVVGREGRLDQVLSTVQGAYDIILLDCAPSLSLLCVNALVASDAFVVPSTPHFLATEGVVSLLGAVDKVRTRLGRRPRLLGIVMTMVPKAEAGRAMQRLPAAQRERVFRTQIPESSLLASCPEAGQTIFDAAPRSRVADAFGRLAGEVLERLSTRP